MADHAQDDGEGEAPDRVNIDYIKGTLFRTINPTGLIGSITPQGKIQIALYSERQAIPRRVTYKLGPDGELGEALEMIGRDAVVRELEAVVTLDPQTAEKLVSFLSSMMTEINGLDNTAIEPTSERGQDE